MVRLIAPRNVGGALEGRGSVNGCNPSAGRPPSSASIAGDRVGSWLRRRFGLHAVSLRIGPGRPDWSSWAPSLAGSCSTGPRFASFSRGGVRCALDRLAGQASPVLPQRCVRPLGWSADDLVSVHAPWRVRLIAVSRSGSRFQANRALARRSPDLGCDDRDGVSLRRPRSPRIGVR